MKFNKSVANLRLAVDDIEVIVLRILVIIHMLRYF